MGRKPKVKDSVPVTSPPSVVTNPVSVNATRVKCSPGKSKESPKVISVLDSVTVTISIPAIMVSALVSKVGPKLQVSDSKSITDIINKLINDAANG